MNSNETQYPGWNPIDSSNKLHWNFKHGKNFKIGCYCIIEEDVIVGDNVEIGNYVLLKSGTKIGNDCFIDSYVKSSGDNKIGNNVTLRFNSTIARRVYIEDDVFISPNVMTIYSKHTGEKAEGTYIKKGSFIGTASVLGPNITIGEKVVIGSMSYVSKDCLEEGIYVGIPAKKKERK